MARAILSVAFEKDDFELEDAITAARNEVIENVLSFVSLAEYEPAEFEAALARLERLVRLDEAKRVPCMGMIGEWDCLRRATTAPTVLCDRCDRIAELEAEIAEAVK